MENNGRKRRTPDTQPFLVRSAKKISRNRIRNNYMCSSDSSPEDSRNRTPSGTVLTKSVKDIRSFFSPVKGLKHRVVIRPFKSKFSQGVKVKTGQLSSVKRTESKRQRCRHTSLNTNVNKRKCDHDQTEHQSVTDDSWESDLNVENGEEFFTPLAVHSQDQESEETLFLHHLAKTMKEMSDQDVDQLIEQSQKNRRQNKGNSACASSITIDMETETASSIMDNRLETNAMDNPETMSITNVVEMLAKLKDDLKQEFKDEMQKSREIEIQQLQQQFRDLKKDCVENAVSQVTEHFSDEIKQLNKCQKEVAYWKLKSDTLTDVCQRMSMEIEDLTTRVENLELTNAKRMVIISGLFMQGTNKSENQEFLFEFFQDNLGIEILIDDCYTIGVSTVDPAPIVVITQNIEDKREIIRRKKSLKNLKIQGRSIYINDYLPPTAQEKRRREREVIDMCRPEDINQPYEVKYTKAGLTIQGWSYQKESPPPHT